MTHPNWRPKLLAAASSASESVYEMIEAARDSEMDDFGPVGSGETTDRLADSLRLLLEATGTDDDAQLLGALVKYLDERG